VVAPVYTDIQSATEGLFAAHNKKGYGFINEAGQTIVAFIYQDAIPFSEGAAAVQKDSQWIFIDRSGQKLFPQSFKNVTSFSTGLAAVTANDSTYGYIDKTGNWVIEPNYEFAEPFNGDTAIVTIKEKNKKSKDFGLSLRYKIDKTGKNCYKLINPNVAVIKKQDSKKKKKK
jgi:hypothetical protein